jgi:hypothetical protein
MLLREMPAEGRDLGRRPLSRARLPRHRGLAFDRLVRYGCDPDVLSAYLSLFNQKIAKQLDEGGLGCERLSNRELIRLGRDLHDVAGRLERLGRSIDALPQSLTGQYRYAALPHELIRCRIWIEAIRRQRKKGRQPAQDAALAHLIEYVKTATGSLHASEIGELVSRSPETVAMWHHRHRRLIAMVREIQAKSTQLLLPPPSIPHKKNS